MLYLEVIVYKINHVKGKKKIDINLEKRLNLYNLFCTKFRFDNFKIFDGKKNSPTYFYYKLKRIYCWLTASFVKQKLCKNRFSIKLTS